LSFRQKRFQTLWYIKFWFYSQAALKLVFFPQNGITSVSTFHFVKSHSKLLPTAKATLCVSGYSCGCPAFRDARPSSKCEAFTTRLAGASALFALRKATLRVSGLPGC